MPATRGSEGSDVERILFKAGSVRLKSATRIHELESLVSSQPCCGGIRSRALYTPPVTPPELGAPEAGRLNFRKELSKGVVRLRGVKA